MIRLIVGDPRLKALAALVYRVAKDGVPDDCADIPCSLQYLDDAGRWRDAQIIQHEDLQNEQDQYRDV